MGKAVALELSKKGASVIVVARTISKLQAAVDEMKVKETSLIIRLPLLTYN
jgi:3-dehydrosphinganine reductase